MKVGKSLRGADGNLEPSREIHCGSSFAYVVMNCKKELIKNECTRDTRKLILIKVGCIYSR